jgi:hypothetical protein
VLSDVTVAATDTDTGLTRTTTTSHVGVYLLGLQAGAYEVSASRAGFTTAKRTGLVLQLRFEAENALNQVNFQGPIMDQTTTPGLFVAAARPRIVQIGAKISF